MSFLAISLFETFSVTILPIVTPNAAAMETVFVTASKKAGRYSGPIYVRITASNPEAKIWYTCRRDGTPSDLLKYESPILLTKSCALIYFAYVTSELESKIERSDYTILYSDKVKLETTNDVLGLRNTGDTTVDIGGWELIAGTGGITIPPGTTLTPGAIYEVGKVDPASYELKSPEWYIKSQLSIAPPPIAKPIKKFIAKAPIPPEEAKETPAAAVVENQTNPIFTPPSETLTAPVEISQPSTEMPNDLSVTPVSPTPIPPMETAPVSDPAANIKASSAESKNTSSLPIVAALAVIASAAMIGKRLKEKK